jgi:RNase P/RNase MRP subunit POP5
LVAHSFSLRFSLFSVFLKNLYPKIAMSQPASTSVSLSEVQQKLLLGPNGKTILELAHRFSVTITLPSGDSTDVIIAGKECEKALAAIVAIVEPRAKPANSSLVVSINTHSSYTYLKYRLTPNTGQLDEKTVKSWLVERLETFLGVVGGGSLDVDVVVVNVAESSFLLRVPSQYLSSVQGALVLGSEFSEKPAKVEFLVSSTSFTAVAAPDRVSIDSFSTDPMD